MNTHDAIRGGNALRYVLIAAPLAAATAVAVTFDGMGLSHANIVMTYLLAVVSVSLWLGRGPAVVSSVSAVLLYNYLFTAPHFTFHVEDSQYLYTFLVMLVVALIVSELTVRLRDQARLSRLRERRTEALYRLSRRLAETAGVAPLVRAGEHEIEELFGGRAVFYMPREGGLGPVRQDACASDETDAALKTVDWVFRNGRGVQQTPDGQAASADWYLPLTGPDGPVGVFVWRPDATGRIETAEHRQLLETFVDQIALALERERLAAEAQRILAEAEVERLRSSLLSAVSHDLRTPLAAIAGSASSLVEGDLDPPTRKELARTIYEETDRLSRLVENLLHLTRIESGSVQVRKQWQPLDEVIGSALRRMDRVLCDRPIRIDVPADLPLVPIDGLLIEQILLNLVENADKFAPRGTPIEIRARAAADAVEVCVCDRGPGLSASERSRVFDKFYRSGETPSDRGRGAGLGLAICKAIAQAHGGDIRAEARAGGGSCFVFVLPLEGEAPPFEDKDLAVSKAL